MATEPYTTTELITKSWYLSGIVARDFETVSGDQLNDGLQLLNALLSFKTANDRLIPYFSYYDFNFEQGVEKYFIPDLVYIETLTFLNQTVRFATGKQGRKQFFGSFRAENVQSLPMSFHIERTLNGSNLWVYYQPNQTFPARIWGKFSLSDVSLGQDLTLNYDKFYIEYLRYALAQYMCQEYNITFPSDSRRQIDEFEQMLIDISPLDLTMEKSSTMQLTNGFNYADANLGRGWRPE